MKRPLYKFRSEPYGGVWRIERHRLGAGGRGKYGLWDSEYARTDSKRIADRIVRLLNRRATT